MGLPGASQVVPPTIPGFPPILAANPDVLQQSAEAERIARFALRYSTKSK